MKHSVKIDSKCLFLDRAFRGKSVLILRVIAVEEVNPGSKVNPICLELFQREFAQMNSEKRGSRLSEKVIKIEETLRRIVNRRREGRGNCAYL